ncbi:MAG TPA: 2-C-methyl-D-erythritol 4-phosphate cytidylyltransferase [Urbifossiella sp.]|jgi:2-C-methyl-D-erythritol 4-phosphate cytidylyltransferase|nr:2-C-methyl-D-erythritol 4-phosphate cytidylyltransferase [Urbifossiella sp.]
MPSVAVIIPAAGQSTRFGGVEKKPFVSLDGRPVWQRSAELFWKRSDVSRVYLVLAPGDREEFHGRFGHRIAFENVELVDGGAERFESVANALARVPESVDLVAVHDAVRPLGSPAIIDGVFAAAAESGAAVLAVPVADTLKRVEAETNRVTGTTPRTGLWQAQTPQVFRRAWLLDAYARRAAVPPPVTDDAQLVEAAGYPVVVVPGAPTNFKITTKDDLALAELILKSRSAGVETDRTPTRFADDAQW